MDSGSDNTSVVSGTTMHSGNSSPDLSFYMWDTNNNWLNNCSFGSFWSSLWYFGGITHFSCLDFFFPVISDLYSTLSLIPPKSKLNTHFFNNWVQTCMPFFILEFHLSHLESINALLLVIFVDCTLIGFSENYKSILMYICKLSSSW